MLPCTVLTCWLTRWAEAWNRTYTRLRKHHLISVLCRSKHVRYCPSVLLYSRHALTRLAEQSSWPLAFLLSPYGQYSTTKFTVRVFFIIPELQYIPAFQAAEGCFRGAVYTALPNELSEVVPRTKTPYPIAAVLRTHSPIITIPLSFVWLVVFVGYTTLTCEVY